MCVEFFERSDFIMRIMGIMGVIGADKKKRQSHGVLPLDIEYWVDLGITRERMLRLPHGP